MLRKHISTFIFSIAFFLIVIFIIAFPSEAYAAAFEGLKLWFNVVCPALLPFFICIEILIGLGVVSFLGSLFQNITMALFNLPGEASFAFFMSISSGYPVGAKITSELRLGNACTANEGQRMLSLCSTSGPLFIIGAVATGILRNPGLGFLLAVAHYLSAITIGIAMKFYGKEKTVGSFKKELTPIRDMLKYRNQDGRSIGALLGDSVRNGINLILLIGGFIIFFSVITSILKTTNILSLTSRTVEMLLPFHFIDQKTISCLFIGIMEVTNGIKECAALQLPLIAKAAAVSFMIGFGGLSVNAQVLSIISKTDLKFGLYLLLKLVQGFVASAYAFLFFLLSSYFKAANVYNIYEHSNFIPYSSYNWLETLKLSAVNMLMIMIFLIFLSFIIGLSANTRFTRS